MARGRTAAGFPLAHRFRILRTASLALGAVLLWLLLNIGSLRNFIGVYQQRNLKRDSVEALRAKVAHLGTQRESLEKGLFENEKSVRETYRLVRPGEKLILLQLEDEKSSNTAPSNEKSP